MTRKPAYFALMELGVALAEARAEWCAAWLPAFRLIGLGRWAQDGVDAMRAEAKRLKEQVQQEATLLGLEARR